MRNYVAVVVLGQTVVDNLFGKNEEPVGKYVVLNNGLFQTIGVMAPRGAAGGQEQDDVVLLPLTTGKNTSLARSAEFALHATRFDRDTVRLTLVGGVATAYFQLRSLRGRLTLARDNLTIAERVFKVVAARADNGAASSLDRARQQAILLGQQAAIPPLELQERQVLYALAVLVAQAPQGFASSGSTVLNLRVPDVAPGLPVSLLVRRPDLASAEAQLAAAHANVAAARAALLPSISLTGTFGVASASLSSLISAPTVALSVGASLLQPIFDAGRLQAQLLLAQSELALKLAEIRLNRLQAAIDLFKALGGGWTQP